MTLGGRRDGLARRHLLARARSASMKRGLADAILGDVRAAVARWPELAAAAEVAERWWRQIQRHQRLEIPAD